MDGNDGQLSDIGWADIARHGMITMPIVWHSAYQVTRGGYIGIPSNVHTSA